MQQTDSVFSYIYARKAPTITYKRKQHLYGTPTVPRPLTTVTTPPVFISSTYQHRAPPTDLSPISTDDEKENTSTQNVVPETIHQQSVFPTIDVDSQASLPPPPPPSAATKDIFDLSDDDNDDSLVEIRVASSLHTKHKPTKMKTKGKSTNSHTKNMHKKAPIVSTKPPTLNQPSGGDQQYQPKKNATQKLPSLNRTLSAPAPTATTATKPIRPLPLARNLSMLPRLPDTKRRKRNLVSQLKAANGERPDLSSQPGGGNRFYDISSSSDDDDDDDDKDDYQNNGTFDPFNQNNHDEAHSNLIAPAHQSTTTVQEITTTSPTTFSTNYNERMEQEIAKLVQTEFGQDELVDDSGLTATLTPSSSSSSSQRVSYVPENTIRAPVTYKRQNNSNNNDYNYNARSVSSTSLTSSSLSLTELDQEMEQQIQYLLSDDF